MGDHEENMRSACSAIGQTCASLSAAGVTDPELIGALAQQIEKTAERFANGNMSARDFLQELFADDTRSGGAA